MRGECWSFSCDASFGKWEGLGKWFEGQEIDEIDEIDGRWWALVGVGGAGQFCLGEVVVGPGVVGRLPRAGWQPAVPGQDCPVPAGQPAVPGLGPAGCRRYS